ncbi:hypothetical protein [Streptomyces sp. NPDC021212]|uniref:hypothetical protein n=1 Tax=Streptomyces sp. NPDC021212 TaxID=3365118 RepID=UPI00379A683F
MAAIGVVCRPALMHVAVRLRAVLGRPACHWRRERIGGWVFIALGVGVAAAE